MPTGWSEPSCPTGELCLVGCMKAPSIGFTSASQLPAGIFRFGSPAVSGLDMNVAFSNIVVPK